MMPRRKWAVATDLGMAPRVARTRFTVATLVDRINRLEETLRDRSAGKRARSREHRLRSCWISVLGFGSIWTRRLREGSARPGAVRSSGACLATTQQESRSCRQTAQSAVARMAWPRFNGNSGFRPGMLAPHAVPRCSTASRRARGMDTRRSCSRRRCAGQRHRTRTWWS